MSRIVDVLMSRAAFVAIVAIALAFFAYDIWLSARVVGGNIRCWNLPNITVTAALILALYLARQVDGRMRGALRELWLQGTISGASDPTPALQERILASRGVKEAATALLIMLVMVASYAWSEGPHLAALVSQLANPALGAESVLAFLAPMAVGVLSGLVAGAFFGRLATYGGMASALTGPATGLRIRPGHFDGANGLKPVGDFYLFQAFLTAIPLLWLAGWLLALPWYHSAPCFAPDPAYTSRLQWMTYGQWLVVAAFAYLAFIKPVLALRRRLITERKRLLKDRIPQIEAQIAELQAALPGAAEGAKHREIERTLLDLAREHLAIRTMGSWPMDRRTFGKYAPLEIASNVAPLVVGPLLIGDAQAHAPMSSGAIGGIVSLLSGLLR